MAQSPDGTGTAPVRITKSSTSVTSGLGVTQKLVGAAIAFGNVLRGTFGPNGLDKMLYKTNGEAAVTNDGAKIVAELMVKHPAAKMFVAMAESQENSCGDGVTGTLLLSAELLLEAGRLLQKRLHPLTIIEGYTQANQIAQQKIAAVANESTTQSLHDVARTSLTGKGAEGAAPILSDMIVQALQTVDGDPDLSLIHI